ncbi:hypothetical protein PYW08_011894 [Mythimna loreyi]|uniref:Uncharacterized protein n=1 Tax=Mythimna loreyi TaxID=667449 RepID=A0ACC2QKN6_9NEOP|nr:hypothetical protein PYW08_011894 [Mythimna loreyi]
MEEVCIKSSPIRSRHYDIDPNSTTPELNSPESPDLFDSDEANFNIDTTNKISVGTNTDNVTDNMELNHLNMETVGKCYTLGFVIGRTLTMMPQEKREKCIHQLLHCFDTFDLNL